MNLGTGSTGKVVITVLYFMFNFVCISSMLILTLAPLLYPQVINDSYSVNYIIGWVIVLGGNFLIFILSKLWRV